MKPDLNEVALKVFAQLVQVDNTKGQTEEDRKYVARQAFKYAQAFVEVSDEFKGGRAASSGPLRI